MGKAIARQLVEKHAVIILSPNEVNVRSAAEELGCDYVVADVTDFERLVGAVEKVVAQYGRIDCLVNNAGLWIEGELDSNDPDQIKRVLDVNMAGVIYATKAVIPIMKEKKSGLIVMINSQGGLYAKALRTVYQASKWAVTGFTKCLEPELAKYGIAVTGVYPGKIRTKLFEKVGVTNKDMRDAMDVMDVAQVVGMLLELKPGLVMPEVGIKRLDY